MSRILENQELHMKNVLSLRYNGGTAGFNAKSIELSNFIENGRKKSGNTVSVTFAANSTAQTIDAEILIPLEKAFIPPDGCSYKETFKLINAVKIRHEGNPATLQKTCDELMSYIKEKNLTAITPAYIVNPVGFEELDERELLAVDGGGIVTTALVNTALCAGFAAGLATACVNPIAGASIMLITGGILYSRLTSESSNPVVFSTP